MTSGTRKFDRRPYVRLDQGMPENPKVVGLSNSAFRLYVESICWCARQKTNGEIVASMMPRLGRKRDVAELVTAGLLEVTPRGYAIHDYLEFQRSSDEIETLREARGDSGAKGAHARWHVAKRIVDPACELCREGEAG